MDKQDKVSVTDSVGVSLQKAWDLNPAAWRGWSTKWHDWDYQTDVGNLAGRISGNPEALYTEEDVRRKICFELRSLGLNVPEDIISFIEKGKSEPFQAPVINYDEVICPNCVTQFRAIPVNVQKLLLEAGVEPPFKEPGTLINNLKELVAATTLFNNGWTLLKLAHGEIPEDEVIIRLKTGIDVEIKARDLERLAKAHIEGMRNPCVQVLLEQSTSGSH